jgi:hypothetical protein
MAVFGPRANLLMMAALASVASAVFFVPLAIRVIPYMDYNSHERFAPEQPVPFSHKHHASGLGIDCRYCHTHVETSSNAGMPSTAICMTCHSQIWTNAKMLAPDRQSLAENVPIRWTRVYDLPDYVFFDHSIHIAKGVGCSSCHGEVDRMPLTYKARSLTMEFCLDCHRNPGPHLRPGNQIFNTEWHRAADTPKPEALMAAYGIGGRRLTDCSLCHR